MMIRKIVGRREGGIGGREGSKETGKKNTNEGWEKE